MVCWSSTGSAAGEVIRRGAGAVTGVGVGRGEERVAGALSPTSLAVLIHLRGVMDLKLAIKAL